ncbi:MAG: tetratricopeptide repeat protein [Vulcanimicrobiaceae bacterium]
MFAFRRLLAALRAPGARAGDPFAQAVRRLERGDASGALGDFTALLDTATSNDERAQVVNKRGVAYVRLGRRDDALRDFTAALELAPRYAPALANIGNLLFEDGVLDEAIVYYEAAIRADDRYAVAHLNLAVAYRRAGRRSEAVRELRVAHRLEGRGLFRRT